MTARPLPLRLSRAVPDADARLLRRAGHVWAGVVAAVAVTALAVRLVAAGAARHGLDFSFSGVPRTLGSAATIFGANVRLLGVALVAALVVQLVLPPPEARWPQRIAARTLTTLADAILALASTIQALLVGCALGGYGTRTVPYLLPHAPVELAGFALGLGLYLEARRTRLAVGPALRVAALAVVVLAVAAGLEVYTGA